MKRTCSIDGCGKVHNARGLCITHYSRLRLHGDPMPAVAVRPARREGCVVEGCGGSHVGLGYCVKHYSRIKSNGTTDAPGQGFGSDHRHWLGDEAGYRAIHTRLATARGTASAQTCVDCGMAAAHWSYDHTDPHERVSETGLPYSPDLDRYQPRCAPCHHDLDGFSYSPPRAETCIHGHLFDEANTYLTKGRNGKMWRACRTCNRERARARRRVSSP